MSIITTVEELETLYGRPGQILAAQSEDRVGGTAYDEEWPERAQRTLW